MEIKNTVNEQIVLISILKIRSLGLSMRFWMPGIQFDKIFKNYFCSMYSIRLIYPRNYYHP